MKKLFFLLTNDFFHLTIDLFSSLRSPVSCLRSPFFLLSFLLFSSCSSFDQEIPENMAFTCTVPGGTIQLSGNPIYVVGTTTTTGKTLHRLLCRITCTDGAIPGGPWIDSKPHTAGEATFDIHSIVDARFDYELTTDITALVTSHELLAATVTVEIGESYIDANGDLVETWSASTTSINVLKGRLTDLEFSKMTEDGDTFTDVWLYFRFLTMQPLEAQIVPESIVKLFWVPSDAGVMDVETEIVFSDGSYTRKTVSVEDVTSGIMYEIQLSVALLSAAGDAGKTPVSFYVDVDLNDVHSASRYILIDNNTYENVNEFYFVNRLSGVDLVVCTGDLSDNMKSEGEVYNKGYQTVMQKANRIIERGDFRRAFKGNTGFKTITERRFLVDFFASHTAWWKTELFGKPDDAGFGLVPIIITPGSFEIDTTSEDLKSIDFEFEIATTK